MSAAPGMGAMCVCMTTRRRDSGDISMNHECVLQCALPRGKCLDCRHVYRVQPPWEGKGKHFSKEFEAFALTLCREMPVKRASDILGESDQSLWRMLKAYVSEAHEQLEMSKVTCVGVDEMSIRKGHCYASVFADLKARRVLYAKGPHRVGSLCAGAGPPQRPPPRAFARIHGHEPSLPERRARKLPPGTFDPRYRQSQRSGRRSLPQRTAPRHERSERSTEANPLAMLQNLTDEQQQHMDTLDQRCSKQPKPIK